MRLYLSSFRLGNNPEELLQLLGSGRRAALIANAMDFVDDAARAESNAREIERLESIGLLVEEIDLRKCLGKQDELRSALADFDLIWARGGNTFVLRRAFKASGFDALLKEMLAEDAICYGGYSAGICLLAPTLRGLELVDDPHVVPPGYESEIILDGLGVISYSIAPHYRSEHPESEAIEKVVEYFEANRMPYKALRDGEVIMQED